jgi:hypothetical protein
MEMEIRQKELFEERRARPLGGTSSSALSKQDPLSVGFRTSATTNKTPLMDGKFYIGKDLDQASISIAVGDTTGKLGAGPSSE